MYIYVQFDTTIWIPYHMNNIIYGRSRRVMSEALIDEQNANKKHVVKIKLLFPYLPTSPCNESRNCHSPAKPGNNHDIYSRGHASNHKAETATRHNLRSTQI